MKKSKNKVKYKEKDMNRTCCFRCGSYNVKVTSDGTILCQELNCLSISKLDKDSLEIKFKVQEK